MQRARAGEGRRPLGNGVAAVEKARMRAADRRLARARARTRVVDRRLPRAKARRKTRSGAGGWSQKAKADARKAKARGANAMSPTAGAEYMRDAQLGRLVPTGPVALITVANRISEFA